MRKITILILSMIVAVCFMSAFACGTNGHNFSPTYLYDESMHWQACLDEGCSEKSNFNEHTFQLVGTINTCNVCGYNFNTANTYEVNLNTVGGTVIPGVTVALFDKNNQQVGSSKTNIRGKVRFIDLDPADYTAKIDETTLPKGYYVPEDMETISLSADTMKATVKIPSRLIEEQMPEGHKYSVGSVAYDFKTTSIDSNGKEKNISLSSYLSQYNAVILNFWYSSCSPCLAEFPYMNEVYSEYNNKIAVIAINSGIDTEQEVAEFVATTGYDFDFVNDDKMFTYDDAYGVQAYPTTIVIDRYGAVALIESGSMPSRSAWDNLFSHYISADYVPDYVYSYNGSGGGDNNETLAKPDIEMPSSEQIAEKITTVNSLTTKNTFTYSAYDDAYSWPWILAEREEVTCLKTSNKDKVNSYSILQIDVNLKAGQQIFFDYFISTEEETDLLYIQVDKVLQFTLSGEDNQWNNDKLLYIARRDGNYQITLTYQKSMMNNAGEDTVYIKNLRLESSATINGHYDFLYNATDNYTLDENIKIPGEYKGYLNHVAYYFNDNDGFYHVALSGDSSIKSANDPILLADLYYSTPWNSNSVWLLAYSKAGLFNEADKDYKEGYFETVEDYAWLQQNSASRYTPLNKELYNILVDIVADLGRDDDSQDPHKGNDQWLEICRYYVHYGTKTNDDTCYALDNTVEALKWRVAKDYGTMTGDTLEIHVDVYSVHLPRGNYYRFKTTKAGAYLIRSLEPFASDYDPNAQDTMGFICDEFGNILAENDNFVIEIQGYGKDENGVVQEGVNRYALYDNNFYLYVYLEANKTYYVAGCFNDPYAEGEYDVEVKYIGETFSYFTSCATDPAYTFDENDPSFTPFILPQMGKDRFSIGDDGNYYAQEFDGSQGSLLYIRLVGPTYLNSYTNYTLEQLIESGGIGSNEADKLYLKHLLIQSKTTYDENHELYGYVVATERLVSIINKRANGSDTEDSNTYSNTSWLLTAYYYRNINHLTLQQAQSKFN